MSKGCSSDLFDLIHSLNRTEKRYVRLQLRQHTGERESNFLRLFDALERQQHYDEREIRQTEKYVRHFPQMKEHLYRAVLRVLQAYHAASSIDFQLRSLLGSIELLYRKGLYRQCRKVLDKASSLAVQYEKYAVQCELARWEERLVMTTELSRADAETVLESVFDREAKALAAQVQNRHYRRLYAHCYRISQLKSYEGLPEMEEIFRQRPDEITRQSLPFDAANAWYGIEALYYGVRKDWSKTMETRRRQVELMEAYPALLNESPGRYLLNQANYLVACLEQNRFAAAQQCIEKSRPVLEKGLRKGTVNSRTAMIYICAELLFYFRTGNLAKGHEALAEAQLLLKVSEENISPEWKLTLYAVTAYLYFSSGEYSASARWLHQVLQHPAFPLRKVIQSEVRLLWLIVQFELNNQDLLESALRSVYRYLCRNRMISPVHQCLVSFMRHQLRQVHNQKELLSAFQILKGELDSIAEPMNGSICSELVSVWLESKIRRQPFAQILREKRQIHE